MGALNKMTATGIPNVRRRVLGSGDVAYYIKVEQSYVLAGLHSKGMTAMKAFHQLVAEKTGEAATQATDLQSVGRPQATGAVTLADVFVRFEGYVKDMHNPTKTMTDYLARYRDHIKEKFGHKLLGEITATEVGSLYEKKKAQYSESMAYQVCSEIRYLYNRAIEWGMYSGPIPMGKGKAFVLPMPQRKREEVYTTEDVTAILTELASRSKDVHDQVKMAYMTGLRLGELFNIQECHVNVRTGVVKIVDPKGKRDTYAQLTSSSLALMVERMTGDPTGYIFKARDGGKVHDLSKTFMRVVNKLKLNEGVTDSRFKKTFHNFRHTFATEVLASGEVSIGDLKYIMGHKSVKTTERYTHPSAKALGVAAGIMEGKLG